MKRIRFALILMALGALACLIGLARVDFKYENLSTGEKPTLVSQSYPVSEVAKIMVDMGTDDVRMAASPDDDVHVAYYVYENDQSALTLENGLLTLSRYGSGTGNLFDNFIHIRWNTYETRAEILVPEAFAGDVRIDLSTGSVYLEAHASYGNVTVDVTTGSLRAENLSAENLTFHASTGSAEIRNITVRGDLRADATTGSFTLEDARVDGAFSRECATGGTVLTRLTCPKVFVNSSTGGIRVQALDARDIALHASTGSIQGSLAGNSGEYAITSKTHTGGNTLPEKWGEGERKLNATTTTGSIDLTFE